MRFLGLPGGLGDRMAFTAVIREVKRVAPGEMIEVAGSGAKDPVLLGNPYIGWSNGKQKWGDVALQLNEDLWLGSMPHSFARQLGIELVDDTPELYLSAAERAAAPPVPDAERTIALDPWAYWAARRWPYARYVELVDRLRADGWKIVELGARKRNGVEAPRVNVDVSYFNRLGVRQAAALLERCALFVGNDSGLMHVAAAVGTPQVIMFGSIRWYARAYYTTTSVFPYSACNQHCFIDCYRRVRHEYDGNKHKMETMHCMNEITVDRVVDAVRVAAKRWLPRAGAPRPEARYGPPTIVPAPIPEKEPVLV